MKIANIELGERALLLAPMEDVTDPSRNSKSTTRNAPWAFRYTAT